MEFERILYQTEDHVAHIMLNQPDKLNVLGVNAWRELERAFQKAQEDEEVTAVVLYGNGRSFCAGFDMQDSVDMKEASQWQQYREVCEERDHVRSVWECSKTVVAAVQGHCLGSGSELTLMCDLVIAADNATFGETELRFSTTPQPSALWYTSVRKARELLMLADRISAQEAYEIGLVNRVVPADSLMEEAGKVVKRLSRLPTETMQITKRMMNRALDGNGFLRFNDWGYDFLHLSKGMPTRVGKQFDEIAANEGMKAAITWMNERYR